MKHFTVYSLMNPQGLACAVFILLSVGCGGPAYEFVPVAGEVTLDGNPLTDAEVRFQPLTGAGSENPGPGSVGRTHEQGEFVLHSTLDPKQPGAVPGEHRVWITTAREDLSSESGGASTAEQVPPQYLDGIPFQVPPEGTDRAVFELTSH